MTRGVALFGHARASPLGSEHGTQVRNEAGDVFGGGMPHDLQVDREVAVNESIAHRRDRAPGDLWMLVAELMINTGCRFADELEAMTDRYAAYSTSASCTTRSRKSTPKSRGVRKSASRPINRNRQLQGTSLLGRMALYQVLATAVRWRRE